jgi:hypothetical protein
MDIGVRCTTREGVQPTNCVEESPSTCGTPNPGSARTHIIVYRILKRKYCVINVKFKELRLLGYYAVWL